MRVSKKHTSTNLDDLFTKTTSEPKREGLQEKLHIERWIGLCGFPTLARVYHKQLTYLYWKQPN